MTDYRSILLYYSKGNNNTQIATLCKCTRKTVIKTIKIAQEKKIEIPVPDAISDKQLMNMLYPNRASNEEYAMPDFEWEKYNMTKHRTTKELSWKRYQKRCIKEGKKPYSRTQFYKLYQEYFNPPKAKTNKEIITKLETYNYVLAYCEENSEEYKRIKTEKEEWLKSIHLDEKKI